MHVVFLLLYIHTVSPFSFFSYYSLIIFISFLRLRFGLKLVCFFNDDICTRFYAAIQLHLAVFRRFLFIIQENNEILIFFMLLIIFLPFNLEICSFLYNCLGKMLNDLFLFLWPKRERNGMCFFGVAVTEYNNV